MASAMQSETAAEAMRYDGVRPETLLMLAESYANDCAPPGAYRVAVLGYDLAGNSAQRRSAGSGGGGGRPTGGMTGRGGLLFGAGARSP
jgi:hypothetical protein